MAKLIDKGDRENSGDKKVGQTTTLNMYPRLRYVDQSFELDQYKIQTD